MEQFGEFIMNMRIAAGWDRKMLACKMCLSYETALAYERGEKLPENRKMFERYLQQEVVKAIRAKRELNEIRYVACC